MTQIRTAMAMLKSVVMHPLASARHLARVTDAIRARDFAAQEMRPSQIQPPTPNPLRDFFDRRTEGRGIWKWRHYFDLYHRHLSKFVGTNATLAEVGVYSGGSLEMWRDYLGPNAQIIGIDIEPACKAYEAPGTSVFIGDQADPAFWADFRRITPRLDVLIDDGGHQPHQQIVTLEETLPHLQPGGVYICEDIHGIGGHFAAYLHCLADQLNASAMRQRQAATVSAMTRFQSCVNSIHFYPFAVVIERGVFDAEFVADKKGTHWQPFFQAKVAGHDVFT